MSKTRIEVVPNIHTGLVMMIHEGRVIGEFTPDDAEKFSQIVSETGKQAKRLHDDFTKSR